MLSGPGQCGPPRCARHLIPFCSRHERGLRGPGQVFRNRPCCGTALERTTRFVQARWWNCRTGTVRYRVNDALDEHRSGGLVLDQPRLQQLVDRCAEVA